MREHTARKLTCQTCGAEGHDWPYRGALCDSVEDQIARLTRERDEARRRASEYHRRAQKAEAWVGKTHEEIVARGPSGLGRAFANVAAATWKRRAEESAAELRVMHSLAMAAIAATRADVRRGVPAHVAFDGFLERLIPLARELDAQGDP